MSDQSEINYEEFYVTCNPPLLPDAVGEIIQRARSELMNLGLIEILFEAEIPWFKCISEQRLRPQITEMLQDMLSNIIKDQTCLIDLDEADSESGLTNEAGNLVDLEIMCDDPTVTPWITYSDTNITSPTAYDAYRYPDFIVDRPFKAIWRGIQQWPGANLQNLMEKVSAICGRAYVPIPMDQLSAEFEKIIGCSVDFNLERNVLYLYSDIEMSNVTRAISRLENIIGVVGRNSQQITHMISTSADLSEYKFAYRWLSHLGLAQRTFIGEESTLEYSDVLSGAALRVARKADDGKWILDLTTYTTDTKPPIDDAFTAFQNYTYVTKADTTSPLRSGEHVPSLKHPRTNIRPSTNFLPTRVTQEGFTKRPFNRQSSPSSNAYTILLQQRRVKDLVASVPTMSNQDGVQKAQKEIKQRPMPHGSWGSANANSNPTLRSLSKNLVQDSVAQTVDKVDAWIDKLNGNSTGSIHRPHDDNTPAPKDDIPDLIEFGYPQLSRPGTVACPSSSGLESLDPVPWNHHMNHYSDVLEVKNTLIDLESEPARNRNTGDILTDWMSIDIEERLELEMPLTPIQAEMKVGHEPGAGSEVDLLGTSLPSTPQWEASLLDLDHTEQSVDSLCDAMVNFGLQDETPKKLHQTMNQQSSRIKQAIPKTDDQQIQVGSFQIKSNLPHQQGLRSWSEVAKGVQTSQAQEAKGVLSRVQETKGGQTPRIQEAKGIQSQAQEKTKGGQTSQVQEKKQNQVSRPDSCAKGLRALGKPLLRHQIKPTYTSTLVSSSKPGSLTRTLESMKSQIRPMVGVLEILVGEVALEVKLGRVYFKNPGEANVNIGSGPLWAFIQIENSFNSGSIKQSSIGFSTVLSTYGADANGLAQTKIRDGLGWQLAEKRVVYEFSCRLLRENASSTPFVVRVNAETFDFSCHGTIDEISSAYVHCPEHAWDLKVCATRTRLSLPKECEEYAKFMTSSLAIKTNSAGELSIQAREDETQNIIIHGARIRHYAIYRSEGQNGQQLKITMTRPVRKDLSYRSPIFAASTRFSRSSQQGEDSIPREYFEASLSSWQAEESFKQNVGLEFGDRTSWTCEDLERDGVFDDLCRPALSMVAQMDRIGLANDNKQGPNLSGVKAPRYGLGVTGKKEVFW